MKIFGYTITKTSELENQYNEILMEAKAIRKAKHPNSAEFQHEVKLLQAFLLDKGFTFLGNETAGNGFVSAYGNGQRLIWLSVNHNGTLANVFENINARSKDLEIKLLQSNENLELAKGMLNVIIKSNELNITNQKTVSLKDLQIKNASLRTIYNLINKL